MDIRINIGRGVEGEHAIRVPSTCTKVSRNHATIHWQGGVLILEDNGSTNGTFVNGSRITQTQLNEDDVVWLGGFGPDCYRLDLENILESCREAEESRRDIDSQQEVESQSDVLGTHVFNEQKKRLEPVDDVCVFCGQGRSSSQDDNLFIPIYKEGDRIDVVIYKSVSYNKLDVGVARCPKCKEIHRKQNNKALLFAIVIGVFATFVFSLITVGAFEELGIIMVLPLGVLMGFIGWKITQKVLEKRIPEKENILSKREAALQYDFVNGLLAEGWTFNKPTAT